MKIMMIRKLLYLGISSLLLFTCAAQAGKLYRFTDENGVQALSRSLPPEAAQRGYDILDDVSMRVIERIPPAPTEEEIAQMKAEQAREAERQRQAEIAAREAEKIRQQQRQHDLTLLMTYPTEADLIEARDKDLSYRQEQIQLLTDQLPKLEQRLQAVQKEAAQRELSGGKITANMQKRLDAAQEEILLRRQAIEDYRAEVNELSEQYDRDLARLRELLAARNKPTN